MNRQASAAAGWPRRAPGMTPVKNQAYVWMTVLTMVLSTLLWGIQPAIAAPQTTAEASGAKAAGAVSGINGAGALRSVDAAAASRANAVDAVSRANAAGAVSRACENLIAKERQEGALSSWAYVALSAAGRDVRTAGYNRTVSTQSTQAAETGDASDTATLIFLLRAGGKNPADYEGRNIVQELLAMQSPSGKFADNRFDGGERLVNAHIWAILSLTAAGAEWPAESKEKARQWLQDQQHADGSFHWDSQNRTMADVDSTGMALMALAALGETADRPAVQRAVAYLQSTQEPSGGFASWGAENPESIAMVINALSALGHDPASAAWHQSGGGPIDALLRFQRQDGAFTHVSGGNADEMATFQAILALRAVCDGKPFFVTVAPTPVKTVNPASQQAVSPATLLGAAP
ncbi:hypothetical protein GTO89_15210 [Heliobacterium gestii]|uniref:Prenyltransferase alpha-alpha toroid domain-containing protein n=1 Tax=Heliomicrobium gestii TaxID=2699 RepID=A0A845LH94_HELGE|nr:prenyltransferase/squalene oxidase repeat-containing protein [Heliomicrobium gestii]MBM7868091.1 hypothetical protein [Heliomicrobium gestii]MZP44380.1 hypothetical protein [Heliomicrobium gestii]